MELRRVTNLHPPVFVAGADDDPERVWTPYPLSTSTSYSQKPTQLARARLGLATLSTNLAAGQELLFGKSTDMTIQEVWAKLLNWYTVLRKLLKSWSDEAQSEDRSVPEMLALR